MIFEKCLNCNPGNWQPVNADTLRQETTPDERHMMIFFLATVRTATAKYRRHIPEVVKDWAKPETQSTERTF